MDKLKMLRRWIKYNWDFVILLVLILGSLALLYENLSHRLNVLNAPYAFSPTVALGLALGFLGIIVLALYIPHRRREARRHRRCRIIARVTLLLALGFAFFIAYRQISLIHNPPGRRVVIVEIAQSELMQRFWKQLDAQIESIGKADRVKMIKWGNKIKNRSMAKNIMKDRDTDILAWIWRDKGEAQLKLEIAQAGIPKLLADALGVKRQKIGFQFGEDTSITLALKDDPSEQITWSAFFLLGCIHHEEQEYKGAIAYYQWAYDHIPQVKNRPDIEGPLLHLMGLAYHLSGAPNEAVQWYKRALFLNDTDDIAHRLLADAYYTLNDLEKAAQEYNKAIEIDPTNVDAYAGLGKICLYKQDYETAIAHYKKALEIQPEHVGTHNDLGYIYFEMGEEDKAFEEFKRCIEIDSNDFLAHANLGTIYDRRGDPLSAAREYKRAIEINFEHAYSHVLFASALYKVGGASQEALADKEFATAINLDPGIAPLVHTELGLIFEDRGQASSALEEFEKAAQCAPDNPAVYLNLADCYKRQKRPEEAIVQYREALRINPDSAKAYHDLGRLLLDQGAYMEVIKELEKAISLEPEYIDAYINIGVAFYELDLVDKAAQAWEKAIELDPNRAFVHRNLALVYSKQEEYDRATNEALKAIDLDPYDEETYVVLEYIYEQMGQIEDMEAIKKQSPSRTLPTPEPTIKLRKRIIKELIMNYSFR